MSRRTIAILILVFGFVMLSIVGIIFIAQQNQPPAEQPAEGEDGAPPPDSGEQVAQPVETVPSMVEVAVSLQTVPRGFRYPNTVEELESLGLVTLDMRVAGSVKSNVVTSLEEILGKYTRTDVYQGETLTIDSLAADLTLIGNEKYGPSSLIPPGSVAAALPMDRLSGVAYGAQAGDYVDILITFAFWRIDEEFQTYLENNAAFYVEEFVEFVEEASGPNPQITRVPIIVTIQPFGRFEELPTGDLAHISPSEPQRPILVSALVQNARVIQVGPFVPRPETKPPTPIPEVAEGEETVTATPAVTLTPPPNVIVVAVSPQQQLFLKYANEVGARIDFALRGTNDGQLYTVENVDIDYILQRFNIEIPPNIGQSVDQFPLNLPPYPTLTPSPVPTTPGESGGNGGGGNGGAPEGG